MNRSPRTNTAPTLTPWYPPEIKPVRKGVYERDMEAVLMHAYGQWSYWNGVHWCGWASDRESARNNGIQGLPSLMQDAPWRGLARRSK